MIAVAPENTRQHSDAQVKPAQTLMIHGLWARMWQLAGLKRALKSRVGPTEIFDYDTSGSIPFETLGRQLADAIRAHCGPVNLVAFSMGGLVARAAHMADPTLPIHRAVFINSPHRGSLMAHLLPWQGIRQMRPNCQFLRRLDEVPWNIPTLAVWCPLDTMVIPGSSARWERATQTICCLPPVHPWPLFSRRFQRRIAEFLLEGESIQ